MSMSAGFDTIVVGIDGSAAGLAALEQAERLVAPGGGLVVVSVADEHVAALAGQSAAAAADAIRRGAREAVEQARAAVGFDERMDVRLVTGRPSEVLLHVAETENADLIAVGSHDHRRITAILIGSVAGDVLHRAPCSVLVARAMPAGVPARIIVGVDGSETASAALELARKLAAVASAPVVPVAAGGGKTIDVEALELVEGLVLRPGSPVGALVGAAGPDDLVVVGSRGLHGLSALGSVSERVAHQAPCSVLVVRR